MIGSRLLASSILALAVLAPLGCEEAVPDLGPKDPFAGDDGVSASSDASTSVVKRDAGGKSSSAPPSHDASISPVPDATGSVGGSASDGLPCDVDSLLARQCRSCHGTKPIGGAPMSLVSYDDLAAASPSDASKTNAESSLEMMQAGTMPPRVMTSMTS